MEEVGFRRGTVERSILEEQLFRAMATFFDQRQRHGVARLVGMGASVNIVTPTVQRQPLSKEGRFLFSPFVSENCRLPRQATRSTDRLRTARRISPEVRQASLMSR